MEFEREETEISSIISFSTTPYHRQPLSQWLFDVNKRDRESSS